MAKKVAVIFSGGMDSATLLTMLVKAGHDVTAISFDYGQRHSVELGYARTLASDLKVKHHVVPMSWFGSFVPTSALTGDVDVPEGHYGAESMKATVVPNRNMVMLSIAASIAIAKQCAELYYGAHPGDHAVYPDCRPEFVDAMKQAIAVCDWSELRLRAPFVEEGMDKTAVACLGRTLNVDWTQTWSCYKGGEVHCGNCGTCVERREALAHVGDPTIYSKDARPLADLLAEK